MFSQTVYEKTLNYRSEMAQSAMLCASLTSGPKKPVEVLRVFGVTFTHQSVIRPLAQLKWPTSEPFPQPPFKTRSLLGSVCWVRTLKSAAMPDAKKSPRSLNLGRNPPLEEGGGDRLHSTAIYVAMQPYLAKPL